MFVFEYLHIRLHACHIRLLTWGMKYCHNDTIAAFDPPANVTIRSERSSELIAYDSRVV